MNARRHHISKRWAPGASFLLATALFLLVMSPGAHAAATFNSTQSDAIFWLLREMQGEVQSVVASNAQNNLATERDVASANNATLLASTRAIENAAQRLKKSRKRSVTSHVFTPPIARDISVEIAPHASFASSHENAARTFAPRFSPQQFATFERAFFAAVAFEARFSLPSARREYSQQLHAAAYRNGVRSNSFPQ